MRKTLNLLILIAKKNNLLEILTETVYKAKKYSEIEKHPATIHNKVWRGLCQNKEYKYN